MAAMTSSSRCAARRSRSMSARRTASPGSGSMRTGGPSRKAPSYLAIASTRPVADFAALDVVRGFGLSLDAAIDPDGDDAVDDDLPFRAALVRLKRESGLYLDRPNGVTFLSDDLFRATIPLPANVPLGIYQVETRLLADGVVLTGQRASLEVIKTGFDDSVARWATDRSVALRPRHLRHRPRRSAGWRPSCSGATERSVAEAAGARKGEDPRVAHQMGGEAARKQRQRRRRRARSARRHRRRRPAGWHAGRRRRSSAAAASARAPRSCATGWRWPAISPVASPAEGSWRKVTAPIDSASAAMPGRSCGSGSWLPAIQTTSRRCRRCWSASRSCGIRRPQAWRS